MNIRLGDVLASALKEVVNEEPLARPQEPGVLHDCGLLLAVWDLQSKRILALSHERGCEFEESGDRGSVFPQDCDGEGGHTELVRTAYAFRVCSEHGANEARRALFGRGSIADDVVQWVLDHKGGRGDGHGDGELGVKVVRG